METDSVKTDEWKGRKDLQQWETSSEEAVVRLVFVLVLQEGWQIPLCKIICTFLHYYPAASPPPYTHTHTHTHTHRNHSSVPSNSSELIIYCSY